MKTAMLTILLFAVCAATAKDQELSPRATAERNRDLMRTYSPSVVTVRYYFQKTAEGEEPKLQVPYLCPNCERTHFRDVNAKVEKCIPMEVAGFVVGADRVLVQDLLLPTNIIGRITVETPSGEVAATEFERAPDEDALALKTEKPLDGLKPLAFTGVEPKDPKYFFLTREDGVTVCGVKESGIANIVHYIELDRDFYYMGNPNTLVIDEQNMAVTLSFKNWHVLGAESFRSPSDWKWEPATVFHTHRAALKTRLAKGILPVYIQLEAKPKDERGGRISWRMDDDDKNDIDTIGVVLENGKILVLAPLAPDATARLQRMEATLGDGAKIELAFEGSLKEFGALIASFKTQATVEPLVFARRPAIEYLHARAVSCYLKNRGGKVDFRDLTVRCGAMKRVENNEPTPDFQPYAGLTIGYEDRDSSGQVLVDDEGGVIALALANRQTGNSSYYSSSQDPVAGSRLLALSGTPELDPENVPRKDGERRRVAWFGVDVQTAGADVIRAKKAASYLKRWSERAPLVTAVATNSPAYAAGVEEGDILVSARRVGDDRDEPLSVDNDYASRIDWNELFDEPQFVDASMLRGVTPWPSLEGGVNETFAKFGVGVEVEVVWVRDGVRMTGKCTLALAPVHFENAPKKRNKELGMTVCDMTDEVRKYFKLEPHSPGVIITKLKSGGPAAVAGLKPFELITEVNGIAVMDAKGFSEKTKDEKKLTFSVRRLTATRVVPINL